MHFICCILIFHYDLNRIAGGRYLFKKLFTILKKKIIHLRNGGECQASAKL